MAKQASALLIVEKGSEDASVIPLEQATHVIGKLPDADIPLDNPFVSRRHAQILMDQGRFKISDLGSKNGTYVNGLRLTTEPRWLNSGDRIELGRDQVLLRFQAATTTLTLPDAWVQGVVLEPRLSRKEFDVLELLYRRRGEACSKDDIAGHAWPERSHGDVSDQEIEQRVRRLRLRVEQDPSQPRHILNVRGYGYKLAKE